MHKSDCLRNKEKIDSSYTFFYATAVVPRNFPEKTRGPFLESPETLWAIFGCHNSLCISRTERTLVVKLHSHLYFCYLENMLKVRISKTSGWQFRKWLFRPEKFSGLSRSGPQASSWSDVQNDNRCFFFQIGHEHAHWCAARIFYRQK